MTTPPPNHVRSRRTQRGLTQAALADLLGISRQSLNAIEAGRSSPGLEVALHLGLILGCSVEDLFTGGHAELMVWANTWGSPPWSGRARIARIHDRWVAHPLREEQATAAADGWVSNASAAGAYVKLIRPAPAIAQNILLLGCAPALGLLASHLNATGGAARFHWLPASSGEALAAVAAGAAHVAGVHLVDPTTGDANVTDTARALQGDPLTLITLARWQVGLVTRPQDADRLRDLSDLGSGHLALVRREDGAGAQRLLSHAVQAAGLPPEAAAGRWVARSHAAVARAVASGMADVGVAPQDVAQAFGLRLLPLADERYDLVIPSALMHTPPLLMLLNTLTSQAYRDELRLLGYDPTRAGQRVAEVHPKDQHPEARL